MVKSVISSGVRLCGYLLVLLSAIQVPATTRTWSAASAGDWNVAASWSGGVVLGSADTARFDGSSIQNCAS